MNPSLLLPEYSLLRIDADLLNKEKGNRCIDLNGESYFMKSPFFRNVECFTEHIASTFIRACGYSAQQTMLGAFEGIPHVLCKDFTDEYGVLETFDKTSKWSLDKASWIYEYDLDYLISYFQQIENCNVEDCVIRLWEMSLFDVLLVNEDRHCANGGFCYKDGVRTLSPLFDNAESLFHYHLEHSEDNFMVDSPKGMLTGSALACCWFDRNKKEIPQNVLSRFIEIDVVSAMDRSTVGFREQWRSFFRSVVYYRLKCLIKGDKFVWEGMK